MGYGGDPPPGMTLGMLAAMLAGPVVAVAIIVALWLT
jgi:hypothetical protein